MQDFTVWNGGFWGKKIKTRKRKKKIMPKDKANDLVSKFYNSEHCVGNHFPNKRYCDCSEMNEFQAKQCAVILCEELIYRLPNINLVAPNDRKSDSYYMQFWQSVKTHIEKL